MASVTMNSMYYAKCEGRNHSQIRVCLKKQKHACTSKIKDNYNFKCHTWKGKNNNMCVIENEDIWTPKLPPNSNNKEKNSEIENIPKLRMHEKKFKVMNDSKKK